MLPMIWVAFPHSHLHKQELRIKLDANPLGKNNNNKTFSYSPLSK